MQETDERFDMVMADPPDNLGLKYNSYKDRMPNADYINWMGDWLIAAMNIAPIVWVSFNSRWTIPMGAVVQDILGGAGGEAWEVKPCVGVFTFGQHNRYDLGNNHRPLWRINRKGVKIYPDQIRVPSWRQLNRDKRADKRGRVPGDVFDFPRVTNNSKQRRAWHPTQLHEGLVERCILLSTLPGQRVLDPFGGTGTTGRVCQRVAREATLLELDPTYCKKMRSEFNEFDNQKS